MANLSAQIGRSRSVVLATAIAIAVGIGPAQAFAADLPAKSNAQGGALTVQAANLEENASKATQPRTLSPSAKPSKQTAAKSSAKYHSCGLVAKLNSVTITRKTVLAKTRNGRIYKAIIGPKVRNIKPYAFKRTRVKRLTVKSPHLKTAASVYSCLAQSNVFNICITGMPMKTCRKVLRAFNSYAWEIGLVKKGVA